MFIARLSLMRIRLCFLTETLAFLGIFVNLFSVFHQTEICCFENIAERDGASIAIRQQADMRVF